MLMPKRSSGARCSAAPCAAVQGWHQGELRRLRPAGHGAGWITARQIEAARIAMTRKIRRGGKVWVNIFPDKPVTQKPAETAWARARAIRSSGWRWSARAG